MVTMKVVFIFSACVILLVNGLNPDLDDEWESFMKNYNKAYENDEEAQHRRSVWENNLDFIEKHNNEAANGQHTFTVGINEFADLTSDEFAQFFNGFDSSMAKYDSKQENDFALFEDMPSEVDWRQKGFVTEVKNQLRCGSCWAFSAVGSIEGQHFNKTGKLVSLSEQNIVDCDHKDHGCMGGIMESAYQYVIQNKGIDTEASYPYTAKTGKECKFKTEDIGATISSFKTIPPGSEEALLKAVATVGPISVAIDASRPTFHFYKKGVYHEPECSSTKLDHGVLAVGYGGSNDNHRGHEYWIVKNSWGKSWGMDGYINMSRNRKNNCGIASHASYPIV